MCGRYNHRLNLKELAATFGVIDPYLLYTSLPPHYNVAPTQLVPAVRLSESGERQLVPLKWGLIPSWAKDKKIGSSLINARADTVATKPSFRSAFKRRRCLIVASGFYEWLRTDDKKQPFHITLRDNSPFAFAGLWEHWQDGEEVVESCSIITTEPNELIEPIHNRMPVILPRDVYDVWLDPDVPREGLEALLRPYPAELMEAIAVNPIVNNARNETPDCITALGA